MSDTLYRYYARTENKHIYRKDVCDTSCEFYECFNHATGEFGVYCDSTFYPRCWDASIQNWKVTVPCCEEDGYDCADWYAGCDWTTNVKFPFGCGGGMPFESLGYKWFCLKWFISLSATINGSPFVNGLAEQVDNSPFWTIDDGVGGLTIGYDVGDGDFQIYWQGSGPYCSTSMLWADFYSGGMLNCSLKDVNMSVTWGNVLYGV